ncbi:unnamed protein product [Moneuplotes crassus]|uniref:BZIP domain-containing protein n=1 Tax=Euplotes crassus TaxID=5936 RepID=A0AAD1XCY1_EUPCR|nr:unnamed protein product [Moneuplotes crassus]
MSTKAVIEENKDPATKELKTTSQPTCNKDRSKAYRKRKKEFLKSLEQRVKLLESENQDLKSDNERLQQIIKQGGLGKISFDSKLKENEDYMYLIFKWWECLRRDLEGLVDGLWVICLGCVNFLIFRYNNIFKKVKNEPDNLRHTMIQQAYENIGEFSPARIELVKKQFKEILDNIVAFDTKVIHCCFKGMTVKEFVQKQRRKRNIKFIRKKGDNSYNAAREIFNEYKFSDEMVNIMGEETADYLKLTRKIQKIAQQLVQLRNDLINTWKGIHDETHEKDCALNFSKQDLANMGDLYARLKETDLLTTHNAWNIPKKIHNNETYEGGEMTDDCPEEKKE